MVIVISREGLSPCLVPVKTRYGNAWSAGEHTSQPECPDLMRRPRGGRACQASNDHETLVQYSRCCSWACSGPRSRVSDKAAGERGNESGCRSQYHFRADWWSFTAGCVRTIMYRRSRSQRVRGVPELPSWPCLGQAIIEAIISCCIPPPPWLQ